MVVTVVLFACVAAAVLASLLVTDNQVTKSQEQRDRASDIAQGASELGYLANDYLIHGESQQLRRWQARYASFSSEVAALHAGTPGQEALVRGIQISTNRLKEVFDSVAATLEGQPPDSSGTIDQAFLQVSSSRLAIQTQGLTSDASRLSQLLDSQADRFQRQSTIVGVGLAGVFVAYLVVTFMVIHRRVLAGMARLQSGAAAIGAGKLDSRIEDGARDEIGELSRAFNQMTANLKGVTASKAELEAEIAARKETEQKLRRNMMDLEASNRELEAFAYSLSHDLREPLRSLDGFSQAVIEDYEDRLDGTGRDYLMRIRGAAQHMSQITEDMLRLSRIVRTELQLEMVDLSALTSSIAEDLVGRHQERTVEFIIEGGIVVNGDASLLQMAMVNLFENSWKFTAKRPQARIEFGATLVDGRRVYFVKDNGVGFDMKYVDKLFQPFQRLHRDADYQGTGVGLATVQRIIRRHGGEIWAESDMGRKTAVYFTLQ